TKAVQAGSGFLSQHSKELLFGLGASERIVRLTVEWPSGQAQTFSNVALNQRLRIEEGGEPKAEPFHAAAVPAARTAPVEAMPIPEASWLYEPFPVPDFSLPDLAGRTHALAGLRGRPSVLLLWTAESERSRAALHALAQGTGTLKQAGAGALAV